MARGLVSWISVLLAYCVGLFWSMFVVLQCVSLAIKKRGAFFAKKDRTAAPACLNDPTLGTHGYAQLKDVKLHYVESGPEDGQLMLMLHGFPEFWYSWRHQIREFNKDYRVVAVDLRGYGHSSKPSAVEDYTVDKLVEDIRELIVHLGGHSKPCIVLGHDWGGAITWLLAALHPHLVDRAVIMNCPHPVAMTKHMRVSWKQFLKSWYMFFVNLPYFPEWFFSTGDRKMLDNVFRGAGMGAKREAFTDQDIDAFKHTYNKTSDFTGPMNYIRAFIRDLDSGDVLRKRTIECPLLLLWGTKDGALNNEMAEQSRGYAREITLQWVDGASHWVQQDEPEVVNACVRKFLAGQ